MGKIEQAKQYTGNDLETVFFRPMLSGPDAKDLGIKVMYNMPVPTTLQFWKRSGDILHKFTTKGWNGSGTTEKFQKTMKLNRVKAEVGYGAEDYFNLVYEQLSARPDINMGDLSGTELEEAETALFREAIAESIRATMWIGDTSRTTGEYNTFDGFLKALKTDIAGGESDIKEFAITNTTDPDFGENVLKQLWENASEMLRNMKSGGNLVFLVTSDVYNNYEESLDKVLLESAYLAKQNGREALLYKGIPVVDLQISEYLKMYGGYPKTFGILTDRNNLALAVNTSDFPGTEISMWYNPDQMENRQRAVFMAGCDYLIPELISFAHKY